MASAKATCAFPEEKQFGDKHGACVAGDYQVPPGQAHHSVTTAAT